MTKQQPPEAFITEFGVEPVPGLPKALPQGDRILWQGAPDWWSFARRVFHVNKIAAWFLFLSGWRMLETVSAGQSPAQALFPIVILLAIGGVAISFFLFIAWMTQRTTVYTLTRDRLVMRVGLALPVTINIPYGLVDSADLKTWSDKTGNIPLKLNGKDRAAYFMLWPHVRPWRLGRPQPMLRCIPEADKVAGIFSQALSDFYVRQEETEQSELPVIGKRRTQAKTDTADQTAAVAGISMPGAAAG